MTRLPDFDRIAASYTALREIFSKYLPKGESERLGSLLAERSGRMQPRIMVYGVYNAGKSTLLNALMGQELASVADRPETFRTTPYSWHGYALLDTPGVDAPVEHEEVAQTELDRSDVILFVIASGGAVSEARTRDAITAIIRRGRRLMLIINDKSGYAPGSREQFESLDELRRQLQAAGEAADIPDILSQVPFRMVNARAALRGRLEGKAPLIEVSGILELENQITDFLQGCDSFTVFESCRRDLLAAIAQTECALQNAAGSAEGAAIAQMQNKVDIERQRLRAALVDRLDTLVAEMRKRAALRLEELVRQGAPSEGGFQVVVDGLLEEVHQRLDIIVESELGESRSNLRKIGELAVSEPGKLQVGVMGLDALAGNGGDADQGEGLAGVVRRTVKDMPQEKLAALVEQGTKKALEFGKENLKKLFKGIGEKTMGKWAANVGKAVGPILSVLLFLYDAYQVFRQENERRQAEARLAHTIADAANEFANMVRDVCRVSLLKVVDQAIAPIDDWLEESLLQLDSQNADIARERQVLAQERIRLQA